MGKTGIGKTAAKTSRSVPSETIQPIASNVFEPQVIEPEVIEPEVIEPELIEPEIIKPEVIEPELIEPLELLKPIEPAQMSNFAMPFEFAMPMETKPIEVSENVLAPLVELPTSEVSRPPSSAKSNAAATQVSVATALTSSSDPLSILDSQSSPYEQYAAQMLHRQGFQPNGSGSTTNPAGTILFAPSPETASEDGVRWGLYLIAIGLSAAILATISSSFQVLNVFRGFAPLVGVAIGLLGSLILSFSMIRGAGKGVVFGVLAFCLFILLGIGLPWLKSPEIWNELAFGKYDAKVRKEDSSKRPDDKITANEEKTESVGFPSNESASEQLNDKPKSKNTPNQKTIIAEKNSEPEEKWERQILSDFPCYVEFPGPFDTRWGELHAGEKTLPFKEQFCEMKSGMFLAVGGARFDDESLKSISETDRRHSLFEQMLLDRSIAKPSRHTVLGEKHPFVEFQGQKSQRENGMRIRIFSNESVIVWALVSGRPEDLSSKAATHFLDSLGSPILKVASNEAPLLLEALAKLKQKRPETDVAKESSSEVDDVNPFDVEPETVRSAETQQPGRLPKTNSNPSESMDFGNSFRSSFEYNRRYADIKSQINKRWGEMIRGGARGSQDTVSKVVGDQNQTKWDIIHPNRLPMIGCNHIMSEDGSRVVAFCPVFDAEQPHTNLANEGYAIAGLNLVMQNDQFVGIQLKFMKVKGKRFDPNDEYLSDWIGQAPEEDETVHEVGGDGRPVFGIAYAEKGFELAALGLVIGKTK